MFAHAIGDVDAGDLEREIKCLVDSASPTDATYAANILNMIYKENMVDLYPNLSICLRVLLTVPITVASGERSFSILKLIKNYLSGLAIIAIESDICRALDYSTLIDEFMKLKKSQIIHLKTI